MWMKFLIELVYSKIKRVSFFLFENDTLFLKILNTNIIVLFYKNVNIYVCFFGFCWYYININKNNTNESEREFCVLKKKELIYQGKAKNLYTTNRENVLLAEYLDQATALNGKRKDQIVGKGTLNNQITCLIFDYLTEQGIKTHLISKHSQTEQLIHKVKILPLEVVLRNVAAGSFSKRFGLSEGKVLHAPIIEFYYKNDTLDDPFINEAHIHEFQLATSSQIEWIKNQTYEINQKLQQLFEPKGIQLIDFKLEFGFLDDGSLVLADEISPDTCRLWDTQTKEKLDKDNYRKQLNDLVPIYQEVLNRLKK